MADRVSKVDRSRMMSLVRGKDTAPELYVRSRLFAMGYRFRLHRHDLSGSPDITLPRYRAVVFVNGCFWHGHDCARGRPPSTNSEFWRIKLMGNAARDAANTSRLRAAGWSVHVVWACRLASDTDALLDFLSGHRLDPAEPA